MGRQEDYTPFKPVDEKDITPEIERKELEKVEKIRTMVVMHHPFFRRILLPMRTVIDSKLPAPAATDGYTSIWVNPRYSVTLSLKKLSYIVCHEVLHVVFGHCKRMGMKNKEQWGKAVDIVVNNTLEDSIHNDPSLANLYEWPGDGLKDPRFRSMSADEVYHKIMLKDDTDKKAGKMDHHYGFPDGNSQAEEEVQDRIFAGYEDWAKSKERGTLPAGIELLVKLLRQSQVPWERILWRYIGEVLSKEDYTMHPPNHNYMAFDMILPSCKSEHIGDVVVAIDTSGSCMGYIEEFASEIAKLKSYIDNLTIITCDAEVHEVIPPNEAVEYLRKLKFKGGGGTDHNPVFKKIKELNLRPTLFVGLTDGYSSFPDQKPSYPVLWVLTEEHQTPPWGKTAVMKDRSKESKE